MILETCDQRILAALRCVDGVTGVPLIDPVQVSGAGVELIRNRRGLYVIHSAPGFAALNDYTATFSEPPIAPPPGQNWPVSLSLQITDSTGRYLPREVQLRVPRAASVTADDSLFRAADVPLFPSPTAAVASGWAVIRATVLKEASSPDSRPQRLPWAWIRVVRESGGSDGFLRSPAFALADWRGEALIAVAGLPVTTWDGSSTLAAQVSVRLEVVFDARLTPLPEEVDWLQFMDPNAGYLPDPDALNGPDPELQDGRITAYRLASGRDSPDRLVVNLTPR